MKDQIDVYAKKIESIKGRVEQIEKILKKRSNIVPVLEKISTQPEAIRVLGEFV